MSDKEALELAIANYPDGTRIFRRISPFGSKGQWIGHGKGYPDVASRIFASRAEAVLWAMEMELEEEMEFEREVKP
jgi:hypothetical protein